MDIADYFSRIGLQKVPDADLLGLSQLQDHHMRHIPFENLDVVSGRSLNLSCEALFQKIVTHRRGGYCFELNTLYAALLEEIGFAPVPMLARVWLRDPPETPPRTHLVYRVNIDGVDWISDVGFGGRAARVPLKIEEGYEIDDGDGRIRILKDETFGYRISRFQEGDWSDQYTVETTPAYKADILSGNHWTENHPTSHFKQGIGVGLFTEAGRTSFYDGIFRQRGTDQSDQKISGFEATLEILKSQFGLDLNLTPEERERLKVVLPQ
jgi:N-hydroxyarylamine O-acetyltransferase